MSDQDVAEEARAGLKKEGKYIEILFGSHVRRSQPNRWRPSRNAGHSPGGDEWFHPEARRGISAKESGFLKIKADEEKPITLISLILPIERRKQIYFQSTD